MTHFFNAMNLFLPAFESFMVRVMKKHLAQIKNTDLEQPIHGFIGQEAIHSQTHEKYNKILKAQGYKFETLLKLVDFIFTEVLEKRLGAVACLSLVSGFEHLTTLIAEIVLKSNMLVNADSRMRSLWEWHAAEEIEHSSLAFKFLQKVNDRYWIRASGGFFGILIVVGFIALGMLLLTFQDKTLISRKTYSDLKKLLFTEYQLVPLGWKAFLEYLQPKFYPQTCDLYQYAEQIFSPSDLKIGVRG